MSADPWGLTTADPPARALPGPGPSGVPRLPRATVAAVGRVRPERRDTWMAVGGLVLCFGSFAGLGWAVRAGTQFGFDRALLLALRNPADLSDPIGPRWLEEVARDITALGSHTILVAITLAVIGGLLLDGRRRLALLTGFAIGSGMAASALLKLGFERPRPDLVPHAVEVYTASFPSGHALLSALCWLTLAGLVARAQEHRRLRIYVVTLAAVVTALVGMSRIYLGVHWPSDVLAGWCMGVGWSLLWSLIARRLQRRGAVERVRDLP
ncbi:phosphatase PAP2 family protein [Roseomonas elaeocarpi]|uniref:Phosphatase PAP2 family protein n=1 Tax=Roseomonas elaeocarpi TaxID=907779 RepID=A0ABV6JSV2_9PROT